ncbi:hypothetical protein GE061_003282 [Apolygus lucorum]|uniref:Fringe-like glycosyltransferase domain-containing protein n=1 Tax=Apolygus lucorum TaxID=248454 RepID=A0A8S9X466_APOLU|nr:hypothetical protein GE061_003282 [Apolygus lucorum]
MELKVSLRWFCHLDDDDYLNVHRLVKLLGDWSPQEDWYLGKPSIRTPLEILNREPKSQNKLYAERRKPQMPTSNGPNTKDKTSCDCEKLREEVIFPDILPTPVSGAGAHLTHFDSVVTLRHP